MSNNFPSQTERLQSLRKLLVTQGVDGFLVPTEDEYQNEYVPVSAMRVKFLSDFSGDFGVIVVLSDKAALFTDGRFTLQSRLQLDPELYEIFHIRQNPPSAWIKENTAAGMKIGFDPSLHTEGAIERLAATLAPGGVQLIALDSNPLDSLWHNRPLPPLTRVVPHDIQYAGETSATKRSKLGLELFAQHTDAAIITDPASIAWLLNVRGNDVDYTPVPLSFAILHKTGKVDWFIDKEKIGPEIFAHVGSDVRIHDPSAFAPALKTLGQRNACVRIDPHAASYQILQTLRRSGAQIDEGDDPCSLPKACKNETEIQGMRNAHLRDGAAFTDFIAWVESERAAGNIITELAAQEKLETFCYASSLYRGPSFETISAAGPHAAIVHYASGESTNVPLEDGQFYLIDRGGQYLDGTTDVTRTLALGEITSDMRDDFTRVLKGHIAIAMARFAPGTSGADIDPLARAALKAVGKDFGHSTGHGVGSYLSSHEGPQWIAPAGHEPLRPGMIVSNEPGYYDESKGYGIRTETLLLVSSRGEDGMLSFETLTLAPIDTKAINIAMLSPGQLKWLDDYHARVRSVLMPIVRPETQDWLREATRPLTNAPDRPIMPGGTVIAASSADTADTADLS